jgi:hypothetical protein
MYNPTNIDKLNIGFFRECYTFTVKKFVEVYNMEVSRVELLLDTFISSVYSKKIFPIDYNTQQSDLKAIQQQFDEIISNKGFVYTLADGIQNGLVNPCLTSPNAFKDIPPLNLWKLFTKSTKSILSDVSEIPKNIGSSVGSFLDEIFTNKIILVLIIIAVIFFGFLYAKNKSIL